MSVILGLLGAELVLTVWGGCWARPCASNLGLVSWKTPASAAASTDCLNILRRLMTPIWLLRWFDITRYYPKIAESGDGRGNGVRREIWCARRDSNSRPTDSKLDEADSPELTSVNIPVFTINNLRIPL